ncbi:Uncharacterised protein [Shigella sonnei]|nr:Uncharacterised protein [Shigella sonnei]
MQILTIEIVAKRLRSKMSQHVVPFQLFGPQPGTKAARIGVAQHFAVAHHQIHMVMLFRGKFFWKDAQAARHPQMNDNPALRQLQQQIFSPPLHAKHWLVA